MRAAKVIWEYIRTRGAEAPRGSLCSASAVFLLESSLTRNVDPWELVKSRRLYAIYRGSKKVLRRFQVLEAQPPIPTFGLSVDLIEDALSLVRSESSARRWAHDVLNSLNAHAINARLDVVQDWIIHSRVILSSTTPSSLFDVFQARVCTQRKEVGPLHPTSGATRCGKPPTRLGGRIWDTPFARPTVCYHHRKL